MALMMMIIIQQVKHFDDGRHQCIVTPGFLTEGKGALA
jgi:hypothetical protein